jgi:hypothetical protein
MHEAKARLASTKMMEASVSQDELTWIVALNAVRSHLRDARAGA